MTKKFVGFGIFGFWQKESDFGEGLTTMESQSIALLFANAAID
jgi:hypothetical protein